MLPIIIAPKHEVVGETGGIDGKEGWLIAEKTLFLSLNPYRSSDRLVQHLMPFMALSVRFRPLSGIRDIGLFCRNPPHLYQSGDLSARQSSVTDAESHDRCGSKNDIKQLQTAGKCP